MAQLFDPAAQQQAQTQQLMQLLQLKQQRQRIDQQKQQQELANELEGLSMLIEKGTDDIALDAYQKFGEKIGVEFPVESLKEFKEEMGIVRKVEREFGPEKGKLYFDRVIDKYGRPKIFEPSTEALEKSLEPTEEEKALTQLREKTKIEAEQKRQTRLSTEIDVDDLSNIVDTKTGKSPPVGTTMGDLLKDKGRYEVKVEEQLTTPIKDIEPTKPLGDVDEFAKIGTGPYAKLLAAGDAIIGGLLSPFGVKEVFPETQKSRQALRTLRQVGKAGLLNSSRGAIWEQEKIDEIFPNEGSFWTNPTTEANKLPILRATVIDEINLNNEALAKKGISTAEKSRLLEGTRQLRQIINIIGKEEDQRKVGATSDVNTVKRVRMKDGSVRMYDASGRRIQ